MGPEDEEKTKTTRFSSEMSARGNFPKLVEISEK